MAISSLGLLGSAQVQSSGTTVTITLSAGAPIGSLVVVRVASDNLSETTPTFTAADSKSNTWTQRAFQGRNATAAQGVVGAIITSHLTTALAAADTITVTLSGSVVAKAAYAEAFSGVGVFKFNSTFSSSSFGNVSASFFSGVHVAGDLLLGAAGFETRTAIPGDIDTFQGTWSTQQSFASTSSGTDTDAVTIVGQHKIVTGTGTQQYNFTGPSTDAVGIGAIFGQIYYGSGAITLDGASVLGSNAGLTPDADDWWPVAGGIAGFGVVGAGRLDELQTIDGSGAITLDTVASAGDGSPVVTASGTPTLDGAAVAGTGSPVLTASGAIDLGGATVAGAGTLTVTASGAVTLDGAAVAGAGTLTLTGAGAVDLDSVGAAGDGAPVVTAAGAVDLDGVTVAGAGEPVLAILGSGAIDLDGVTIAGAGALVVNASGAVDLDAAVVDGVGTLTVTGAGAIDLDGVTVAGDGAPAAIVTGSGAITLGSVTVAGAGAPVVTASGNVALGGAVVAGAGSPVVTVAGAALLDGVAVAGAGALVVTGAGAVDLDSVTVVGTSSPAVGATGAIVLASVVSSGAGSFKSQNDEPPGEVKMSLRKVRARIVEIMAGTPAGALKTERGVGPRFVHMPQTGDRDAPGRARGFFLALDESATLGPYTPLGSSNERVDRLRLEVVYPDDAEDAVIEDLMSDDYDVISSRILDDGLWNRPVSTILAVTIDGERLLPARYTRQRGQRRMTIPLIVEHTR